MRVICAGFPKTGTKSMALALRDLGYSVHDFEEHMQLNMDRYLDFFEGRCDSADLMEQYRDVDVVVDQPACTMWNTFFKHYPNAKVILMLRDSPETWYTSYAKMLDYYRDNHMVWYEGMIGWFSSTRRKFDKLNLHNMCRSTATPGYSGSFMTCPKSKENWMNQYIIHNAAVQHLVPSHQLLVYKVGDGWEPICEFLDIPVPDKPFPKENVGGQSGNITDKMVKFEIFEDIRREFRQSLALTGASLAAVVGIGVFLYRRHS